MQLRGRSDSADRTQNKQDIGELNFQGGLFDLPAGQLRSAVGVQYRKNAAQFFPDILQSTASFTDQVIGVYPTAYLDADVSVKDYYGELLVPIVADKPFAKKVELELGGRYSDYSDTASTTTYKFTGNWAMTNWIRFRGGYNRATRAPNLGELFLNTQEIFTVGGANFGDPCGLRSNSPYGAGGAAPDPVLNPGEPQTQIAAGQTAAGANSTYLICRAQMGAQGANTFYSANATGGTGSLFNWVLQQGNANLDSEKADTWTAGFVLNSPSDRPWLSGFSAAIDWWKVDIEDAIQQYSVDFARSLCYGGVGVTDATEALARAGTAPCQAVSRNLASGNSNTILIQYDNQATIATAGIDLAANWVAGLSDIGFGKLPGRIGLNMQATWLQYYRTKQSPAAFDVETDWRGSLGPNLTGTNAGAYTYRVFSSLSYMLPKMSFSLRWRHLPGVWSAAHASEHAIIKNNDRVAAGGDGVMLSYTPLTAVRSDNYDVLDLSFNWAVTDRIVVRGGVDNLLDSDPVRTGIGTTTTPGVTAGYEMGTDLNSICSAEAKAKGCVNPTDYSVLSSGAGMTNGGYYDTLGRRFFLGVKVSF